MNLSLPLMKHRFLFIVMVGLLGGCNKAPVQGISPELSDKLTLAEGLDYKVLITWSEPLSENQYFGYDNDDLLFIEQKEGSRFLWVNHVSIQPEIVSRYKRSEKVRQMKQVEVEKYNTGITSVRVKRWFWNWKADMNNKLNLRITADTPIPFEWHEPIAELSTSPGTVANGSACLTPWGTVLSGEAHFEDFYGEMDYKNERFRPSDLQWETFTGRSPELFGWVMETDPLTGVSRKHVGLGRFHHGAMTVMATADGRAVVYMGDDHAKGSIYKYISEEPEQLYPGNLYAANLESGVWEPIDYSRLGYLFATETEMYIRTAEAAEAVGATSFGAFSGMDIHPVDKSIWISVRETSENPLGQVMKLTEVSPESLELSVEVMLEGGESLANPGAIRFDPFGNLWIASDIPSSKLGSEAYSIYGSNALFVQIQNGSRTGELLRVANAPNEASFGGMCFDPDGESLFASVKHPGQLSVVDAYTSHWPEGENSVPKPAVVVLSGYLLDQLADY